MKIPISEIFESIQWEWRNTWKPSVFVRFWWCNLKCTWCDSKYSWDPKVEKANTMGLKDVIKKIRTFKTKHIIFTWWEPTLYQKEMKAIYDILEKEKPLEYTYELETNWSNELTEAIYFNQINVSPKLENSWNKEYEVKILEHDEYGNLDLKFVCATLEDCLEVEMFIQGINKLENFDKWYDWVYIMPLGTTKESQINKNILKFCIHKEYNYCLRQHVLMFWDKKWV